MGNGVLAIFGYTSASSSYTLQTYSNLYKYPFISMSSPTYKFYEQLGGKKNSKEENEFFSDEMENQSQFKNDEDEIVSVSNDESSELSRLTNLNNRDESGLEVEEYQINMAPDMIPILVSLLKYNRWKRVYYLYNYQEGSNHFKAIDILPIINFYIFLKRQIDWKVY